MPEELTYKQRRAVQLIVGREAGTGPNNFGDIAKSLGVAYQTLWEWRRKPELQLALARERDLAIGESGALSVGELLRRLTPPMVHSLPFSQLLAAVRVLSPVLAEQEKTHRLLIEYSGTVSHEHRDVSDLDREVLAEARDLVRRFGGLEALEEAVAGNGQIRPEDP